MSNPDEGQLKREIDKISHDVKKIMEKVEALYPKKTDENKPDTASGGEDPGEVKNSGNDEQPPG